MIPPPADLVFVVDEIVKANGPARLIIDAVHKFDETAGWDGQEYLNLTYCVEHDSYDCGHEPVED